MDNKRRTFLKFAGVAAALGAGGSVPLTLRAAYAPEQEQYKQDRDALTATRWGMVIDMRKFTSEEDFERCIEACHSVHNVPDQQLPKQKQKVMWIWTDHYEHAFPSSHNPYLAERVEHKDFLLLCNQCDNPPCVRVCPTKATFQREDGIVQMDFHRCIGCRYCMAGCPYGSRSFNFCDPAPYVQEKNADFPTRMRGVVEKCNFCVERLEEGLQPACVEAAPEGGMFFGDLDDPNSEVRRVLRENFSIRRKVELGTNPCVFYIV